MALGRELLDDLVADVLRCLPPRSLAVSRCVCRAWRDLVDARRLLRVDLLPRSVGGIFINYWTLYSPEFFARPTTGPSISGDFEFIPGFPKVMDHCNGLVLCTEISGDHDYVANPATRQWARLPLPPETDFCQIKCLAYDPTMSPHYDVFLIQPLDQNQHKSVLEPDQMMMQCEGPVSSDPLQVYVYSSKTDLWEERWFAPEVPVVQTSIADKIIFWRGAVYTDLGEGRWFAQEVPVIQTSIADKKLYWRGAVYLLSENGFVLRISITNAKYTLIPTPADESRHHGSLGRSEKGVYCAFQDDWHLLRIYLLMESCGQMVWELRHSVDLRTFARKLHAHENYGDKPNGPWILQDNNHYKYPCGNDLHREIVDNNIEWNSDNDNVLSTEDMVEGRYGGSIGLLGFHPYKEIVFLDAGLWRAVAYHWNTSKFQDLGNIYPKDYLECAGHAAGVETSFIYTPCWMEDFPKNCLSVPIEDQHNVNMQLEELVDSLS